jgi:hypothetical protein
MALLSVSTLYGDGASCSFSSASMAFEVKCGEEESKFFFFDSKTPDGKYIYKIEGNNKEQLIFDTIDLESGVYTNGAGQTIKFEI